MRTAPGKERGYIICPVVIPKGADPEQWLSVSRMEEGWQELGQILLALRAHDQRIEENLESLIELRIPREPESTHSMVAVVVAQEDSYLSENDGEDGEGDEESGEGRRTPQRSARKPYRILRTRRQGRQRGPIHRADHQQ